MIDTSSAFAMLSTAGLTQNARILQAQTSLSDALTAERFTLHEGVSQLFSLTLDCVATSAQLDVAPLLGQEIGVSLLLADGSQRHWYAVVDGVDALGADGGMARYRIHAGPWLGALGLGRDSYIYQDKSVTDILTEIFADYPQAAYSFDIADPLPARPVCTQYRESDLAFALRIMAEAGLSFRFDHQQGDDQDGTQDQASQGGGARHRLVVFDAKAALPANAASPIRFHRSDATETEDSITRFHAAREVQPNAVTRAGWDDRALEAHAAQVSSHVDAGAVPSLEDYDYDGDGRYADNDAAARSAGLRLQSHESRLIRYEGAGTARQLAPGETIELTQHDRYGDEAGSSGASGSGGSDGNSSSSSSIDELGNRYTLLSVTHEAANNLGSPVKNSGSQAKNPASATKNSGDPVQNLGKLASSLVHPMQNMGSLAQDLGSLASHAHAASSASSMGSLPSVEPGSYRNRFTAQPEAAAVVPPWFTRPTAPEGVIAMVVTAQDQPISSGRDLRVKVQFPWQRGKQPLPGGLPHQTVGDDAGNAPGDDGSGTWLRVSSAQAGSNWGASHLPRKDTEVVVEFLDGDIDRPVLAAQLYNDSDLPPWSSGVDADANHGGVLSGWHSSALDGNGHNQWLFDDTSGQLRMRLSSSTAASQLGLGHLVEQAPDDASRGAWRGMGFEMRSDAWAVLRSGQGMLLSANADPQASSSQADAGGALKLLRSAQNVSQRLDATATQHQAPALAANAGFDPLIKALDPQADGKHPASVNGQPATKATVDGRTGQQPVERIDGARVLIDAPQSLNLATPASAVLHAGGNVHSTVQTDAHIAAQQTYAAVAGGSAGIYAQEGGIQAVTAQSPLSLRAHTDALDVLAQKDLTVVSSTDSIEILAKNTITLQAAGASITLDGGDVIFKGPGIFSVKGASHSFNGPASDAAQLPQLPQDRTGTYTQQVVYKDTRGDPFEEMPFNVAHKPEDNTWAGHTPQEGQTERVYTEEPQPLEYGLRYAKFKFDE